MRISYRKAVDRLADYLAAHAEEIELDGSPQDEAETILEPLLTPASQKVLRG